MLKFVVPDLVLGIYVLQLSEKEDVDGRDCPAITGRTNYSVSNGTLILLFFSSHSGTGNFFERMKSGLNSLD